VAGSPKGSRRSFTYERDCGEPTRYPGSWTTSAKLPPGAGAASVQFAHLMFNQISRAQFDTAEPLNAGKRLQQRVRARNGTRAPSTSKASPRHNTRRQKQMSPQRLRALLSPDIPSAFGVSMPGRSASGLFVAYFWRSDTIASSLGRLGRTMGIIVPRKRKDDTVGCYAPIAFGRDNPIARQKSQIFGPFTPQ
jgi:hypothetical protein